MRTWPSKRCTCSNGHYLLSIAIVARGHDGTYEHELFHIEKALPIFLILTSTPLIVSRECGGIEGNEIRLDCCCVRSLNIVAKCSFGTGVEVNQHVLCCFRTPRTALRLKCIILHGSV